MTTVNGEREAFALGVRAYVDRSADRSTAIYRLTRSVMVGQNLTGALQAGKEISRHAGVNRINVLCMDPRNITGLQDLGVRVIKFGGAIGATREVLAHGGKKTIKVPDSDYFAGLLQSLAMSNMETLVWASGHFGEIPCGEIHRREQERRVHNLPDPYNGDRVKQNIDLIQQGTIEPATNIFNQQRELIGVKLFEKLGVNLPWNTDKASLVLDYHFSAPRKTLMVADLVANHAHTIEDEFGESGWFRTEIKDLKLNGAYWRRRTEIVKKLTGSTKFKGFQNDAAKWMKNSAQCDGLTANQLFGLMTEIASNAALIYEFETFKRKYPLFAEFFPHQIFLSLNGVALDEKDPVASRLSASPLNGEDPGDTLVAMTNLSFEKGEMVQEINNTHRGHHRLFEVPPRRTAFLSFGINPDSDTYDTALTLLGKAMRAIKKNPRAQKFIQEGKLFVIPVIVDSRTSAAISVPVFPDYFSSR